jgi:hypothetical protein
MRKKTVAAVLLGLAVGGLFASGTLTSAGQSGQLADAPPWPSSQLADSPPWPVGEPSIIEF